MGRKIQKMLTFVCLFPLLVKQADLAAVHPWWRYSISILEIRGYLNEVISGSLALFYVVLAAHSTFNDFPKIL